MFKSSSGTSEAESVVVGEIRSPCGAGVEVVDAHVVITASSVSSRLLQAASAAAASKPVQECLLKSTEAISSSRLYSDIQTHVEGQKTEK